MLESSLSLKVGDMVACEPRISQNKRVFIARVDRVHSQQELIQVTLYHVPPPARFGPWQRRPWEVWQEHGQIKSELLPMSEIVCKVELRNGALTLESLETLGSCGINTGTQPSRDSTLPSRQI